MTALLRSLAAWAALAGTIYLIGWAKPDNDIRLVALWIVPALLIGFTIWSLKSPSQHRVLRVTWWVITGVGWAIVVLALQGAQKLYPDEQFSVLMATGLGAVVAVWVAIRAQPLPWRRCAVDAGIAVLVVATGIVAYAEIYDRKSRQIAERAMARWSEIGRPMAEFEETIGTVPANESLAVVSAVLEEQFHAEPYKGSTPRLSRSEPMDMSKVYQLLEAGNKPIDEIDVTAHEAIPLLEARDTQLSESYRQLLAANSPVWALEPAEGWRMRVPNYLALRMMSQLFAADALRRFSLGDQQGAANALSAIRRATAGLEQNPLIVSTMIHVAVDALATTHETRLPSDPSGFETLKVDAIAYRQSLERGLQLEALLARRVMESAKWLSKEEQNQLEPFGHRTPKWFDRLTAKHFLRRQCAIGMYVEAEQVRIMADPNTLTKPDLGADEMDRIAMLRESISAPNFLRAHMRLNAVLLLREQSLLVRQARHNLATSQPVQATDSIILPGCRWEPIVGEDKNSVALKLASAPRWITENQVTTPEFWILPLDGSRSWKFREVQRTADLPTR